MSIAVIRELFENLGRHPAFQSVVQRASSGEDRIRLSGLTTPAKAIYLVLLAERTRRPLLVLAEGNKQAEALSELLKTFFEILVGNGRPGPQLIPALDVLPSQALSPHSEISAQRAVGLWRMATGRAPITVTPVASALLRTGPASLYRQLALTVRVNDEVPLEELVHHLDSIGYERREPVEMVGEYSVRGGILDVFPAEESNPVRIEFFGDTVESMRRFEVETQRSIHRAEEVTLLPLVEHPRSVELLGELARTLARPDIVPGEAFGGWEFYVPLLYPRDDNMFSLLDKPVIVWDEPEAAKAEAERLWKRLEEPADEHSPNPELNFYRWGELLSRLPAGSTQLEARELHLTDGPEELHIPARSSMAFHGNVQVAVAEARNLVDRGNHVVFFAPSIGEVERLADILREYSVPFQFGLPPGESAGQRYSDRASAAGESASTYVALGLVLRGVSFPDSQLAVFGFDDLFDSPEFISRPQQKKPRLAAFAFDLADLKPGDYVVHVEHGIGRFVGLREIQQGDSKGDFMLLEYAGESRLYVPLSRLDLVEKYRGVGDSGPSLDKLGGATWTRTKNRVKAKMRDMADELIKLYAERKIAPGFPFSADSNWQHEFEDSFEFQATRDQVTAVREIKRDMEAPHPMDRLLCGDVGFGKTEVAMRAAFKALGDGKQVALLAPTTVLSYQHYETFKRRFAAFPVRVELLSRFRSPRQIKTVLADLAAGKVDIVIGTHRLLSKDVEFRDLGILIVDEEQRFGVAHKERLKRMKKNVDVLTMSATPIPRTLHMSLLGLRDMSVIETPPKDRLAIHTVVAHFNPELVKAAIEQEMGRGGQVYFVHNRVDTIWQRAAMIQSSLPHVRVGVGHGQMGEVELEKALLGFMRHEFDVFVSTTIVENGLDIPLANTIIIENAERYGLSELYQLRGRVGRSNRRAYAYLLIPQDTELSEIARKRLAALKEFSDLGAGFRIAALDLELRGAGNLLGGEQHGHIEAVGFDMYVRLLEETVRELKGEEVPVEVHSNLSLGLDIRIPPEYISDEQQRLRAYKRIADASTRDDAGRVLAELEDRYGSPPAAVAQLAEFSLLKTMAQQLGIESVERRGGFLNIKFHKESRIEPAKLMNLVQSTAGVQFTPAGVLRLPVDGLPGAEALIEALKSYLAQLS